MSGKRIFGIILFIAGVAMIGASMYIKTQVLEGREQISSAQKKVDTGKGLFSMTPYTKDVGDALGKSAQKKIEAGTAEADKYEKIAGWLQIGGIVFMIGGAFMIIIGRKK